MKVFTYFVEPASYTLDLIYNIHNKLDIKYAFLHGESSAKSDALVKLDHVLEDKSTFSRIRFIYQIWRSHDIIIVNGYNNYPFLLTFIINTLSPKKRFIAIESDTQLGFPRNIFKRFIKKVYLNLIFRNSYVLGYAGGSMTHKELFRYYGMEEDRIFLMPMMIDNKRYYQNSKKFPDKFTFLFVGRLLETKNVDILCETFLDGFLGKDAQLIIVGTGKNQSFYEQRYSNPQIKFKGSIFGKGLIDIYHQSSAFVFPSTQEAWGLVINEAMSSSLPIIAHQNVGAVHDLVVDKKNGYVIKDWDELKLRMLDMYNDHSLCKDQSIRSLEIMREYWNYNLYECNLLDSIKKVRYLNLK